MVSPVSGCSAHLPRGRPAGEACRGTTPLARHPLWWCLVVLTDAAPLCNGCDGPAPLGSTGSARAEGSAEDSPVMAGSVSVRLVYGVRCAPPRALRHGRGTTIHTLTPPVIGLSLRATASRPRGHAFNSQDDKSLCLLKACDVPVKGCALILTFQTAKLPLIGADTRGLSCSHRSSIAVSP